MNVASLSSPVRSPLSTTSTTIDYPNLASDSGASTSSSLDFLEEFCLSDSDESPSCMAKPLEPQTCLYWVRMSSLRVHDNPAFTAAMRTAGMRFRAVFMYDPWFESGQHFGLNRWRFLIESLEDLDKTLQSYGTRLYVAKGQPLVLLEKLCIRWNVRSMAYQIDKDVDSHILEQTVDVLATKLGITLSKFDGHTLYESEKLVQPNSAVMTLKEFKAMLSSYGPPEKPIQPPAPRTGVPFDLGLPEEFRLPTLQEVGFSNQETVRAHLLWMGGESVALQKVTTYVKTRAKMNPVSAEALLDKSSLSPYIRFGCLSVRYLFWKVKELVSEDSSLEEFQKSFISGLLTREFFFTVASQVPNFDSYYNNKICVQLPWSDDKEMFRLWRYGKTGFPWIDAAMRQLWQEGWIHYLLRESVAFFLTRGELWISWEQGRRVFGELLLDYENSVSSGCWMKSSGSAFINETMEFFCPVTYGTEIDPAGDYIRTYIPELKNFPNEYIYCPWTAPVSVQVAASCRIGSDYPLPIINHITTGALCNFRLQTIMSLLHSLNTSSPPVSTQPPASGHDTTSPSSAEVL
ncbi:cryptochrome-2-like isoform X3 [Halichondria panicea]|uniref:cryptochrome-2-like isoform X3 n=1 Tax=Halichondria panicea TaxID=6063 RepID=UPI00312B3023